MKPLATGDPLRLGPYRLLGVLGEGGMGKVYVGQDGAGTVTAVKVLRPELAHEQNLAQRFVREARAAQAVTGTGVARVLGAQTEGGRPWIATEFLAGPTLDEAVDAYGPFDEAALRALAASLARTLADIHAAGLIHRDLKPPNIVLTSSGPRIIDFGIARPEHGLTLTTTDQIPVTPGYGAPEQVMGRRVEGRADVFSLGAVLVYAATGRRAFDGSHVPALQYNVVHGEPQFGGMPEPLRTLIEPCLAKDPAHRPYPLQIASAFAPPKGADRVWRRGPVAEDIKEREDRVHELTDLAGAGSEAPRTGVTRRRLLTTLGAGGAVLAGGGGAAAWWFGSREPRNDPFDIPKAVKTPMANLLDADEGDFVVGEELPEKLWARHTTLSDETPAVLPVRDVIVFGALGGGLDAHNVVDGVYRWSAPEVNPRGRYLSLADRLLVALDDAGTLRTYVPATGQPKWTAPAAEGEELLAADDEAVYLLTKDGRLRAVGTSDAKVRWTARVPSPFRGKVEAPGAAGRGRLVLRTSDGDVFAVRTGDGSRAWELREQSGGITIRPAVHGDTVYLNGKNLTARRLADNEEVWTVDMENIYDEPQDWGPPTVDALHVHATATWPVRLGRVSGQEVWNSAASGAYTGTPVVPQGAGVWGLAEYGYGTEVFAVGDSDGRTWTTFKLPGEPERRWLLADGNRVFVMHDRSLTALPVFAG